MVSAGVAFYLKTIPSHGNVDKKFVNFICELHIVISKDKQGGNTMGFFKEIGQIVKDGLMEMLEPRSTKSVVHYGVVDKKTGKYEHMTTQPMRKNDAEIMVMRQSRECDRMVARGELKRSECPEVWVEDVD